MGRKPPVETGGKRGSRLKPTVQVDAGRVAWGGLFEEPEASLWPWGLSTAPQPPVGYAPSLDPRTSLTYAVGEGCLVVRRISLQTQPPLHPRLHSQGRRLVATKARQATTTPVRPGSRWRVVRLAAVVVAATAGALGGVVWWQERPLREARSKLDAKPQDALAIVDQFLEDHPRHSRAAALRGRALVLLGRSSDALRQFDQIGAASAEDVHAWGQAYMLEQQWSLAVPMLKRALDLEPNNSDALREISGCRMQLGLFDEALESAKKYAVIPGNEAFGQELLAKIYHAMGNDKLAADAYDRVLRYRPNARQLHERPDEFFLEFGRTMLNLGRPDDARELFVRSLRLRVEWEKPPQDATKTSTAEADPGPRDERQRALLIAEGYVLLGNALSQAGKAEQAELTWKEALQREPTNREAIEALADAALQRGDAQAALTMLDPLLRGSERRAGTAYLFQRAYTLLKDEATAQKWAETTATLRKIERRNAAIQNVLVDHPQSFWAQVIRAYRFAQIGNFEQAQLLLDVLDTQQHNEPFVTELAAAVRKRSPLPSLDGLPIKL